MGFRLNYEKAIIRPLPLRSRRARLLAGATFLAASLGMAQEGVHAASDIKAGSNYLASGLGSSVNADFKGGTLQLDQSTTITKAFTVEDYSSNLIDEHSQTVTFSGAFTGSGPMTFGDSVGGGSVTLTSSANAYTGSTTINSNGVVLLSGSGTLASSSGVDDEGVLDISQTTSGASLISLSGAGSVILGAKTLTVTDGSGGTFSGVMSGTGGFTMNAGTVIFTGANTYTGGTIITGGVLELGSSGTSGSIVGNVADAGALEFYRTDNVSFDGVISGAGTVSQIGSGTTTLTAVNTYTGATSITLGTLALSGNGSIAASSSVAVGGIFDISATSGASIKSFTGAGTIQLGAQNLTITAASGTFSGVITGSGGVIMNGGTELLSGANTYTGATIVNGGTLQLGASAITYNVTDNATLGFNSASAIAMTGIVSGSGGIAQSGAGTTTISTAQAYTGATTITTGTLALSGAGSIASSSGVADNSTFSVADVTGAASITSLSGIGTVQLGSQTLVLTNAQGVFSGTIAGTGGVTLLGGSETLAGVDTYTGVTTISGGTLYVSGSSSLSASSKVVDNGGLDISSVGGSSGSVNTSIITLSGSGSVALGAKTLILTGAADTFSGIISGSGSLTINGGIETLSGVSTYTGVTTISAGTLALSGGGRLSSSGIVADSGVFDISAATGGTVTLASLSGSGTVNLGAQTLNLANASTVFSGVIAGTGILTVSGGTQILSGTNTYSGGTTIIAGTLQIGNSSSIGSIIGNVADSGTLAFDRSDTLVFSGTISGTGGVSQIGDGTTILTAANNYTGGTVISTGTLQIGDGGATGSITGDVTDYGTLAFGRTDSTTFTGTISGTGGVTLVSGTTSFTTVQSYSGATLIDTGAELVLFGTGSIANSSLVTDNGVLDLSAATGTPRVTALAGSGTVILGGQSLTLTGGSGTFSGAITGSGGVTVTGGNQTFSGNQAYTGATLVSGGKLSVNGSITSSSSVTVTSSGILGGSGTVSSLSVTGGTVAPGVSGAGTLHVNGPVSFDSASTFVVTTSSAGVASLSTTGAASLAGTLSVTSADGTYVLGQKTAVLTAAGGVSGSFTAAPIQSSGAQFSSKLSYDANDVFVEVDLAKLSPLLPSTATINQSAPVKGIDAAIAAGNTLPSGIQNLGNLSSAALATGATQLDGELGGDMAKVGSSLLDPFFGAISNHISDGQQDGAISRRTRTSRDQFWLTGFDGADITAADGGTGAHKFKSNLAGIAGGMDWHLAPNLSVGAAASAGFSNFHLTDALGQGKANAYQVAGYGLAQLSPRLYTSFAAGLGIDDVSTNRTVSVSGTDILRGKFTATTFAGRVETGLAMNWATSYIALQDDISSLPNYQEAASSGANTFALGYQSNTVNHASVEIGLRQNSIVLASRGWSLHLTDKLAWQHDFSDQASANANFVALPASKFTVYGAKGGSDAALMSLGTELVSANGFGVNLHVDSEISAKSQSYTGLAGLNFAW